MPDEPNVTGNEISVSLRRSSSSERTEAKFFEDVDKLLAEAMRLDADYQPPNPIAALNVLQTKRGAALTARTANQAGEAAEEAARNARENLFKPLNGDVTSLVNYAAASGKAANEVAAIKSKARDVKGVRARPINTGGEGGEPPPRNISIANLSYASRADNYAEFIELYDSLDIHTGEDFYKASTHRAKLDALRDANTAVINAESASNTTGEQYDRLAYTDADSLVNACIAAKNYIKSKYKTTGQPYKNIAKTRFVLPTRLRNRR